MSDTRAVPDIAADLSADPALPARTVAKITLRLVPILIFLYILNYIDRTNVALATLQMNTDLGFSDTIYAFGLSTFYLSYFLFEVPSNLILQRVGARVWIARIMISWGLISACMMFVSGRWSFYILRFALGAAEAGFFPGILLYLTTWIPFRHRARTIAWFLTSTAASGVIGGPLAALILQLNGVGGLHGWQWLFLLEGLPSVVFGILVYFLLIDRPEQARFLSPAEKSWLAGQLAQERDNSPHRHRMLLRHGFTQPAVWLLCAVYGTIIVAFQVVALWMPKLFKLVYLQNHPHGPKDFAADAYADRIAASLIAIPYAAACIAMVLAAMRSDRTGRRRWPVALGALGGSLGLALAALAIHFQSLPGLVAAFALAAAGIWSTMGPFWSLPSVFVHGTAAAAAIALINSVGNFGGGFIGPNVIGGLRDLYGSYIPALLLASAVTLLTLPLVAFLRAPRPAPS